jgi:hypothetical protein
LYQGVSEPYGSAFRFATIPSRSSRQAASKSSVLSASNPLRVPSKRPADPELSRGVVGSVQACGCGKVWEPRDCYQTPPTQPHAARLPAHWGAESHPGGRTPARRYEALRVEDRRDVSPVCDRGRTRPSSRGGITGEGDNRGTSGGEVRQGGGMSFANSLHCKCPGRDSNPHGVAPKGF